MAIDGERFSYSAEGKAISSSLPYLPLTLNYRYQAVMVSGLLDTGATVNVLPYHIGIELGALWEDQTTPVKLTGNLVQQEARVLIVTGRVSNFPAVRLAFAWTKSDDIPLILGQVNFFMEFDVCFYRSQSVFEIKPKSQS
jgi:hypothetical protein